LNKAHDGEGNDEKESSEEYSVTSKEAKSGLCGVLSCLQRHNIDDSACSGLLNLDNANDRVSASGYTKKKKIKITDLKK